MIVDMTGQSEAPSIEQAPLAQDAAVAGPRGVRAVPRWWAGSSTARAVRAAGPVWLASVLFAGALTVFAPIGDRKILTWRQMLGAWGQYDWGWYQWIAEDGYTAHWSDDSRIAAFFPLYPMTIRVLDAVVPGPSLYAALVVSAMSLFGTLVLLFQLAEREFDGVVAGRSIWYLVAFPTAFFLLSPYPSALFLMLAIGALAAMRTGRWWVAGALCGLASATRSSGLLLVLPFVYEYVRQRGLKVRPDALAVALVPGGLLAFMAYTYVVKGDALAFLHAQKVWTRELHAPWFSIVEAARIAERLPLSIGHVNLLGLASVLTALAAIVLAFVGPWRMRRDQWVLPLFALVQLLFIVSFPVMSMPFERLMSAARHVLEIFPMFLLLGIAGRHRAIGRPYVTVGLGLQGVLLAFYLQGGWIA